MNPEVSKYGHLNVSTKAHPAIPVETPLPNMTGRDVPLLSGSILQLTLVTNNDKNDNATELYIILDLNFILTKHCEGEQNAY